MFIYFNILHTNISKKSREEFKKEHNITTIQADYLDKLVQLLVIINLLYYIGVI